MSNIDTPDFTPEEYREFLDGLGIGGVRLESSWSNCSVWRLPDTKESVVAQPKFEVLSYHLFDDKSGFMAMAKTGVVFTLDEESIAGAEATFVAVYTSDGPLSEEMVKTFVDTNLALLIWPYAREFVQNMVSRFGWEPYALPLFVTG